MTSAADSDFLNPEAAFVLRAPVVSENGDVTLGWDIAPGYYLYRDRIEVSAGQSKRPIDAVKPPGEVKEDPTFGTVQVYHSQATVRVPSAAGQTLGVTWQGCAEAGLCYPPQTRSIKVGAAGSGSGLPDVSGTSIPADATTRSSLIGQSEPSCERACNRRGRDQRDHHEGGRDDAIHRDITEVPKRRHDDKTASDAQHPCEETRYGADGA
jgi:thiol:disulfide interchange protein DsbD